MTNQKILVKIASYRDPELMKTIASALAAAMHPERIEFAIVNQVGDETRGQLDVFQTDPRFTVTEIDWKQSMGLGWARRLCDRMWSGQEFTLQLDSHMRFLRGWDVRFISDLEKTGDPMGVISCYPASYGFRNGAEFYEATSTHQIISHEIHEDGIPALISGQDVPPLSRALIVAGGLQFSRGEVCRDVPNHEVIFYGDEFAHSMRLFTHGYNVYAPSKVTIFHLYERHKWMHVEYWSRNMSTDSVLRRRYDRYFTTNMEVMRELLDLNNTGHLGTARTKLSFDKALEMFRVRDVMTGRPTNQ